MSAPVFIGCSHGTDSREGRLAIRSILADVATARPDLDVREAFVDVQQPEVADVVAEALAGRRPGGGIAMSDDGSPRDDVDRAVADGGEVGAVVVPLLLSTGFHVRVDIAASIEGRAARAAPPLGPDPLLVEILADRLAEVRLTPEDVVVLAAAGSTDPDAARDVRQVAAGLSVALSRGIAVGYGAGAHPRVAEAVAVARAGLHMGGRVVIAAYLLAPGYFYDRLLDAGADVVTRPLAPDPRLAEIALARYAEA